MANINRSLSRRLCALLLQLSNLNACFSLFVYLCIQCVRARVRVFLETFEGDATRQRRAFFDRYRRIHTPRPVPVPFDERVKARFADVMNETVVVLAIFAFLRCCLL